MEEYRNQFDKLMAPLSDLPDKVVEETFMNGLFPWIKAEVDFCLSVSLTKMMQAAQLVENRKIIRNEPNFTGYARGKYPSQNSFNNKNNATVNISDSKENMFPMRTITLRTTSGEVKKEGQSK